MAFVEFSRDDSRAEHLDSQSLGLQLLVQGLGQRDEVGQRPGVDSPAERQLFDWRWSAESQHT